MRFEIKNDDIPLTHTQDDVIVVKGTRVSLDLIVAAFVAGATAEEIASQYPSVPLADVYGAIGYYLRHRDELDRYLEHRRTQCDRVRAENESRFPQESIRSRLVARQAKRE